MRHDKALAVALKGLKVAQEEMAQQVQQENDQVYFEKARLVGISYHNIASEYDKLDNLDESIANFKKAYEFIQEHIGIKDPLYSKFHACFDRVK